MKPHSPQQVLFLSTFPPRVCGLATYSLDLITAIEQHFGQSLSIRVCALEEGPSEAVYAERVTHRLNAHDADACAAMGAKIEDDPGIKAVMVQHEFGLFGGELGGHLLHFLDALSKPVAVTFHTVLPAPDPARRAMVQAIADRASQIIVLTRNSARILIEDYSISDKKISVVPHGTHHVTLGDPSELKELHNVQGRTVLSTFGLLSPNKGVEMALDALPAIRDKYPDVLYLVLGRTHPGVVAHSGEAYRDGLLRKVDELGLHDHVRFVDRYLDLDELLEYLRLTDIYLFTSRDRDQAVSGTFSYAMASGCPVIATRMPQAAEVLQEGAGRLIDFDRPDQLADAAIAMLRDRDVLKRMGRTALQHARASAWENVTIPHVRLFQMLLGRKDPLVYTWPHLSLDHLARISDRSGVVQFCDLSTPDPSSGKTLDDNARGLIALCMLWNYSKDRRLRSLLGRTLAFIESCQQADGRFLNYMDQQGVFTEQNRHENLDDANGRALWALGTLIAEEDHMTADHVQRAERALLAFLEHAERLESPRAAAFAIKGLHAYNTVRKRPEVAAIIDRLAMRLMARFVASSDPTWHWFEKSITYGNAVLPEALLLAAVETGNIGYQQAAMSGMRFLLSQLFRDDHLHVISNRGWMQQGVLPVPYGEQPIDAAYTILALEQFWKATGNAAFLWRMRTAFEWFLGNNHLAQMMYDRTTGGCFDGLEEHDVNLNQGAESTICYLMARAVLQRERRTLEDIHDKGALTRRFARERTEALEQSRSTSGLPDFIVAAAAEFAAGNIGSIAHASLVEGKQDTTVTVGMNE